MTDMSKEEQPKQSKTYWLIAYALIGAVAGYIGADLASGGANGEALVDLTLSQIAALAVGAILVICGVIVGLGAASPRLGKSMGMVEDHEQWEDEKNLMRLSAVGSGAFGLLMVLLALVEPLGLAADAVLLGAIVALVGLVFYTCWRVLHEYDELWHDVNAETCVIAVYLMFAIGGAWSIAAHLGFVGAPAPLDLITLLTAASLVGAVRAVQKRGMLED